MNQDPVRWRNGIVVIRIGNNDWAAVLEDQTRDPKAPQVRAVAAYCVEQITATMKLIHDAHPEPRILLVGNDSGANDPSARDGYSATALDNIRAAHAEFNAQLRAMASSDWRTAFFDQVGWLEQLWGRSGPDRPSGNRAVIIGGTLRVTNTIGDEPTNAELADHHAGLVWNTLWAQALVERLREAFDLPITSISDEEVARFAVSFEQGNLSDSGYEAPVPLSAGSDRGRAWCARAAGS